MKKFSTCCTIAAAILSSLSPAWATTQQGVTVAGGGTHSGQVFLKLASPLTENCFYGTLYAPLTSGFAEYVMSVALSARTAGLLLAQIDYTKSAAGTCTIDLIIL
jgi:hypothetical protein